jgi:Uma2 family endonuclease
MSSPKIDHVRITRNLVSSIDKKLEGSGCEAFGEKQRVYVEPEEFFCYPDLSIVCGNPETYENDNWNLLNPVVLFEVLSPSTAKYDRTEKFERYKSLASFREYILIDSRSVLVEPFIKDEQGNWNSTKYRQLTEALTIASVGISMALEEIYRQTSFPKLTL